MSYMLLCLLPEALVNVIYDFKKINAANTIRNYFITAKKRHYSFWRFAKYFNMTLHGEIKYYYALRDTRIETINHHLTILTTLHYPSNIYSRSDWCEVLNNVSKALMYYYNRMMLSGCVKQNNSNYKCLKACIELWFNLCQKYNFHLELSYLSSIKKVSCQKQAIKLNPIKTFTEFNYSPFVTYKDNPPLELVITRSRYIGFNLHNYKVLGRDDWERQLFYSN